MSIRIIGGTARGVPLQTLSGRETRPTSARVREALFSVLMARYGEFTQASVLDLYAGTGALGLEALSRGAAEATFVDHSPNATRVILANIERCGWQSRSRVLTLDANAAQRHLAQNGKRFDLIFLDPPYAMDASDSLQRSDFCPLLKMGSMLVLEHAATATSTSNLTTSDISAPSDFGLNHVVQKKYGDTALTFFRYDAL